MLTAVGCSWFRNSSGADTWIILRDKHILCHSLRWVLKALIGQRCAQLLIWLTASSLFQLLLVYCGCPGGLTLKCCAGKRHRCLMLQSQRCGTKQALSTELYVKKACIKLCFANNDNYLEYRFQAKTRDPSIQSLPEMAMPARICTFENILFIYSPKKNHHSVN